jgi:hypothetical protein
LAVALSLAPLLGMQTGGDTFYAPPSVDIDGLEQGVFARRGPRARSEDRAARRSCATPGIAVVRKQRSSLMSSLKRLPQSGMDKARVFSTMEELRTEDADWKHQKTWSLVYFASEDILAVAKGACASSRRTARTPWRSPAFVVSSATWCRSPSP